MDILQSSSAAPLAPREAANAPAQQAGGSFQGERVHYVSVSQSLADAAEELTFAFSERAEKSLAKRRLSDAHARLSEVQAMLQEYWKRIPDLESQQKLEALIAHLGSGQLSSLAQLSAYLEGFSSEISQRFLALSRARFAATPLERVVAFLQKALSADLDSQSSRLDPVKLERVMSDMHKLRVLGGLAEQVGALWQVLVTGERGHGIRAF